MSIGRESGEKLAKLRNKISWSEMVSNAVDEASEIYYNHKLKEMTDRQFEELQEERYEKGQAIVAKAHNPFAMKSIVAISFDESLYPLTEETKLHAKEVLEKFYMESEENAEKFRKGLTWNEVENLLNPRMEVEGPVRWKLKGVGEDPLESSIMKFKDYVDEYRKQKMEQQLSNFINKTIIEPIIQEAGVTVTMDEVQKAKINVLKEYLPNFENSEIYKFMTREQDKAPKIVPPQGPGCTATFEGDTFTRRSPANSSVTTEGEFSGQGIRQALTSNGANGHGSIPSTDMTIRVSAPTASLLHNDQQNTGGASYHYVQLHGPTDVVNCPHVYCDPNPVDVAPFPADEEPFYETPDEILLDRYFVFTPRGVAKARIVGTAINHELGCVQYIVETKLPKGVRLHDGGKWIIEDYYYCWDELYATIEDAIDSI